MRILVLGASGQVGSCIVREAERRGHEAVGTYRSTALPGLVHLDLSDRRAIAPLVRAVHPDLVIHCATWAWVDGNERDPDRARRENVETVAHVLEIVHAQGARYCYFSTSYVFDGAKATPYEESDAVSPINVYGRTKVQAEEIVRETLGDRGLIVRTIVVYGPDPSRKNFVEALLAHSRSNEPFRVPYDQIGNPTYGPDLASATLEIAQRGACGVWNVAGPDATLDRVEFARLVCRAAKVDDSFVVPVSTAELGQDAPRPLNGALSIAKLRAEGIEMRSASDVLAAWSHGEATWPLE